MTETPTLEKDMVSAAAEARWRKERRRVIGFWIAVAVMLLVIATVVVLTIGFNNSWWVQKDPVASSNQVASDGSSVFTQAGMDYLNFKGEANVTMTSTRPTAAELGLPESGTKHVDFLIPLVVNAKGAKTVTINDVDGMNLISAGGKLSAIDIEPSETYQLMLRQVSALAPQVGWSADAVANFRADLTASLQANHSQKFTATIGPAASTGMRISATLSGDQDDPPTLVIHLEAAR